MVLGGRVAALRLAGRVLRWRIGWWWLVATSPLLLVLGDLAGRSAAGTGRPALREFGEMNGVPQWTVIGMAILLVVGGHATYNLTAATAAAHGLLAAISTTAVIVAAAGLVVADLLTHGRVLAAADPAGVR